MKQVLVADDEYLMREALAQMISKIDGFEVIHSVDTGKEAVRICEMVRYRYRLYGYHDA